MHEQSGSLAVITGPPGAGKSTVAQLLADRYERSVLVAGDAFFGFLANGAIEPWLPESHQQNDVVTRAAATATGRYVSGGYATVYDGVVGPWFLSTFAVATGVRMLHYVMLLPEVEVCVERVATRTNHAFDDEAATRKMHLEFSAATIADRHVVRNPPNDPHAVIELIWQGLRRDEFAFTIPPDEP